MRTMNVDVIGECEGCCRRTHTMAYNEAWEEWDYLCQKCHGWERGEYGEYGDQIDIEKELEF